MFASASGVVEDAFSHGDVHSEPGTRQAGWPAAVGARCRAVLAARRGVLVVGGLAGAAALVLALTLVPPADERSGPAAQTAGTATSAAPQSGAPTTAVPTTAVPTTAVPDPPSGDADVISVTVDLLRRREACFAELELACLDEVLHPGSGIDEADRVAMVAAQSGDPGAADVRSGFASGTAQVTGRMGDAWLVQVPYTDGKRQPASVLVMRSEAGWRLREIFGAPDEPR